jgi:RNA polymerase sigma-70 factor (sigma-E family)
VRKPERDTDFARFVDEAGPRLRRAAYLLTHHHQDAEDLLQAVLVKAYVAWPKVRRGEAYSYVSRALVNGYIDQRRKHDRVVVTETVADTPVDPDRTVEDRTRLVRLLEPLSERERSMIVLRYYFDQSETDVADHFGVSVGTVKSTASRAMARLREGSLTPADHSGRDPR